jgi:hypothetical protein
MNKKQLKEALIKEGVTDKDLREGYLYDMEYKINNVLGETELTFDSVSKIHDNFEMISYYSKRLGKNIILSYDVSAQTVGELADELFSYLQESDKLENQLPDLSTCAYI